MTINNIDTYLERHGYKLAFPSYGPVCAYFMDMLYGTNMCASLKRAIRYADLFIDGQESMKTTIRFDKIIDTVKSSDEDVSKLLAAIHHGIVSDINDFRRMKLSFGNADGIDPLFGSRPEMDMCLFLDIIHGEDRIDDDVNHIGAYIILNASDCPESKKERVIEQIHSKRGMSEREALILLSVVKDIEPTNEEWEELENLFANEWIGMSMVCTVVTEKAQVSPNTVFTHILLEKAEMFESVRNRLKTMILARHPLIDNKLLSARGF